MAEDFEISKLGVNDCCFGNKCSTKNDEEIEELFFVFICSVNNLLFK
jgi:hypothetical protein